MGAISGTTRIIGLIGTPIVQVEMPRVLNDYTATHGMYVIMILMDVAPDGVADLMRAVRHWNSLYGIVVTVPFKQITAARCDTLTDRARRLTIANVIRRDANGTLTGKILDDVGFVEAARAKGFYRAGKLAGVIGAGGVARLSIQD